MPALAGTIAWQQVTWTRASPGAVVCLAQRYCQHLGAPTAPFSAAALQMGGSAVLL